MLAEAKNAGQQGTSKTNRAHLRFRGIRACIPSRTMDPPSARPKDSGALARLRRRGLPPASRRGVPHEPITTTPHGYAACVSVRTSRRHGIAAISVDGVPEQRVDYCGVRTYSCAPAHAIRAAEEVTYFIPSLRHGTQTVRVRVTAELTAPHRRLTSASPGWSLDELTQPWARGAATAGRSHSSEKDGYQATTPCLLGCKVPILRDFIVTRLRPGSGKFSSTATTP